MMKGGPIRTKGNSIGESTAEYFGVSLKNLMSYEYFFEPGTQYENLKLSGFVPSEGFLGYALDTIDRLNIKICPVNIIFSDSRQYEKIAKTLATESGVKPISKPVSYVYFAGFNFKNKRSRFLLNVDSHDAENAFLEGMKIIKDKEGIPKKQ